MAFSTPAKGLRCSQVTFVSRRTFHFGRTLNDFGLNLKFDKAAADMEYTDHTPLQLPPKANYVNFRHNGVFAKF